VHAYLSELGQNEAFFSEVLESGAHTTSLEMVLCGIVDGTAIDSTVLEWIVAERKHVGGRIRVIDTIGPSPIPPWVISMRVPEKLRTDVRCSLLAMHQDSLGRNVLASGRIERFAEALDSDYDPIRRMARAAERVAL
jgi:phosphonate transport system substrate-binding protein